LVSGKKLKRGRTGTIQAPGMGLVVETVQNALARQVDYGEGGRRMSGIG